MLAEWEPAPDRGLGLSVTHSWAAKPECKRSAAMIRKTWGQYVAVCPRLQLTSHTKPTSTLSRIKCERYIYKKKYVRSFIEARHYGMIMVVSIQHHLLLFWVRVDLRAIATNRYSTFPKSTRLEPRHQMV